MPDPSFDPEMLLADRYALGRLIARGGMSDVYVATDRSLDRQVAVKRYRAGAVGDRRGFEAEVRALASLSHPGLVHLYDAGEHAGDEFVVLELVDGPALSTVLEDGSLAEGEVQKLAEQVADALAYVHEAGVVHRDVTPANILCGPDGRPRLADFGIARLLDTSRITALAQTIGTAAYMAPEQVEGGDVTPAADVYSLGLVLLEALSGRRAFDGVGHEAALARLTRDPDVSAAPEAWRPLLIDMTARRPGGRPAASEVRDRVAALVSSTLATAPVAAAATGASAGAVGAVRDGEAALTTSVLPAAHGGTEVMPIAERPAAVAASNVSFASSVGASAAALPAHVKRRVVVAGGIVLVLGLLTVAAMQDRGGSVSPIPTVPVTDAPVTTEVPTTVPTTTDPDPEEDRKGRGKSNDTGRDDD